MAGLTITGFSAKALSEIQDEVNVALLAGLSPTLNLSSTSPFGQYSGVNASQMRQLWEALQEVYSSFDIEQAEGDALTARCRHVGVFRRPATKSTVSMNITIAANTYAAGSLVVHVDGDPEKRFALKEELTTAGGAITGVVFECEEEGAITANASTVTQIATGAPDLTEATNPAAASVGDDEETDTALRERWRQSTAIRGSTSVDAIRADLLEVDNVTDARVRENVTSTTDGFGIPPGAVAAYVRGGDDTEVAETLFNAKAGGIETYGTTTVEITDSQGIAHEVNFTRPTKIRCYAAATVQVLAGQYPATEFQTADVAIHDCGQFWGPTVSELGFGDGLGNGGEWPPGQDVIYSRIRAAIMLMPGVVDVTSLTLGTVDPPVGTTNISIDVDEYADFDYEDIDVTLVEVTGMP